MILFIVALPANVEWVVKVKVKSGVYSFYFPHVLDATSVKKAVGANTLILPTLYGCTTIVVPTEGYEDFTFDAGTIKSSDGSVHTHAFVKAIPESTISFSSPTKKSKPNPPVDQQGGNRNGTGLF
jgi:hypothetical protein